MGNYLARYRMFERTYRRVQTDEGIISDALFDNGNKCETLRKIDAECDLEALSKAISFLIHPKGKYEIFRAELVELKETLSKRTIDISLLNKIA